jgi:fatty-acid peroxygenase
VRRLAGRTDGVLGLVQDGYEFGLRRLAERETDVWSTRIGPIPVIWLRGPAAAAVFYDEELFQRAGVLPRRVRRTLTGDSSVQGLDGVEHRDRKAMFMRLMTSASITELESYAEAAWQRACETWAGDEVVLTDAVAELHAGAAQRWAGVPDAAAARPAQFRALYDGPITPGVRHWRARAARRRLDTWAREIVDAVRSGEVGAPAESPLAMIAHHRVPSGEQLPTQAAGVELLNVLRPIVAIERLVCFAALALHGHPEWTVRLRATGPDRAADAEHFGHEVRRLAPVFPAVAARVRRTFDWRGVVFPAGRLVLLDLYASNRHPATWERPEVFDPDRFVGRRIGPYDLVPQGGGDHHADHRCAGEWITVRLLRVALDALTYRLDYELPPQDLSVDLRRVPAMPRSGVVLRDVRPR